MFKNMKVSKSLCIGFGVTIVTSLLLIISSILSIVFLSNGYSNIIDTNIRANEIVTTIRLNANIAARNVRDIALIPDDPNNPKLEARANEAMAEINTLFNELETIYPLNDNRLADYKAKTNEWMNAVPAILDAVDQGRIQQAANLVLTECTPKLEAMTSVAQEIAANLETAQQKAVQSQNTTVNIAIIFFIIITVAATIFVLFVVRAILNTILPPVAQVQEALMGFSKGDFNIPVEYESRSELGDMCYAMRKSQKILSAVVEDECYLMDELAAGNFDVRTKVEASYVGRLGNVLTSLREMIVGVSNTIQQVKQIAEQVDTGSEQVASGSQALSQGATEQAASTEELSASIVDVNNNIQTSNEKAVEAKKATAEAGEQMNACSAQMDEMLKAMDDINHSSEQIGKIVKSIEDIAFQTNILALNAAVEAARAGTAGKGFAVVADEVRNLAQKSAEASKNTSDLIEASMTAVSKGVKLAHGTASQMKVVSDCAAVTMERVTEIAELAEKQASAMQQISIGIDQISNVVETNSATAEESAAASEELSGQATILREVVQRFKLRSDRTASAPDTSASSAPSYSAPSYTPSFSGASKY